MIGAPSIHKASHVFVALTVCAAWAAVGCFDTETVDPDVAHESRAIGEPCDWNVQCGSGLCIPSQTPGSDTGWKAGMCTQHCNDGVCDASQVCTMLDDGNYCLPGCSANGQQCRDGYICNALLSACLPDCRNGWACGEGFDCNSDGQCLAQTATQFAVGEPCSNNLECETSVCFAESNSEGKTSWQNGMCAGICNSTLCGAETGCILLDDVSWCLPSCTQTSDCRDGYVCSSDMAICLPDCRNGWDCVDLTCDDATGECLEDTTSVDPTDTTGGGGQGPGPGPG